jgi:hypothetical protein
MMKLTLKLTSAACLGLSAAGFAYLGTGSAALALLAGSAAFNSYLLV